MKQAYRGGIYYLAPDKINEKKYWYSKNGQQGIWWFNDDYAGFWVVGLYEDLGTSKAGIQGPINQDASPTRIYNGWRYFDLYFQSATKGDIKFVDISYQKGIPNDKSDDSFHQ